MNLLAAKHGYETVNESSDANNLGFSMQVYKKTKMTSIESVDIKFDNSTKTDRIMVKSLSSNWYFLAGTVKHEMSVIGVGETFVLAYANCVELQKLKLYFR